MSFEDRINEVVQGILSDSTQLPSEFMNALPQIVAQNPVQAAKTSGMRLASSTKTSSVTTAGTTFAGGADVLATALEFTATGSNSYILGVVATEWHNSAAANQNQLRLNLDGSDSGLIALANSPGAGYTMPLVAAAFFTPAAGEHSVNARLVVNGGTGTISGGSGGANSTPIVVTLEVA